jgi:hypothetical protein
MFIRCSRYWHEVLSKFTNLSSVLSALIAKMFAEDLGLQTVRSIADTDAVQCSTTSYACSSGAGQKMHRVQGIEKAKY